MRVRTAAAVVLVALLVVVLLRPGSEDEPASATSPPDLPAEGARAPAPLADAIGQLVVAPVDVGRFDPEVIRAVGTGDVGGVLLRGGDGLADVRSAAESLQREARDRGQPPLLVLEEDTASCPGLQDLAARPGETELLAQAIGRSLTARGTNVLWGPTLEPGAGCLAQTELPEIAPLVSGLADQRVAVALRGLRPGANTAAFGAAVGAGAAILGLTRDAVFADGSRRVRRALGFTGVVLSPDLADPGLGDPVDPGKRASAAIRRGGADLLVFTDAGWESVGRTLVGSRVAPEILRAACDRVVALKRTLRGGGALRRSPCS